MTNEMATARLSFQQRSYAKCQIELQLRALVPAYSNRRPQ